MGFSRNIPRLAAVILPAAGFVLLFFLEQEIRSLSKERNRLLGLVEKKTESLRSLRAEWSYLTSPARLTEMNNRYLGLKPIAAKQIIDPERLVLLLPISTVEGGEKEAK